MSEPGTVEPMTDELDDLFMDAIENFPEDQREAARDWYANACAALHIIAKLKKGVMP
ncbi:hypothetical protein [Bradyrhizobium erythrophlei]|uniref:Uncharacterized protein n=1 Tax=Bradyrhizobium erythrophlei TaxID=1437360 RepID=A0A1M7TEN4_9BRAD|nr:hypothetical protein [Bradyrhizobium erythrophlei]SHN69190.1 hypothetical protein SAMN05444170_1510 [Bradyrhizobium erythrophlei]